MQDKKYSPHLLLSLFDDCNSLINFLKEIQPSKFSLSTGNMASMSRQDAAIKMQSMGADINITTSKRTDIVIVGHGAEPSKI